MKNAGILSVVAVGLVGLIALTTILNGFMLSFMWQWFVVPLGAPSIGIVHAIGIALLVSMLTYSEPPSEDGGDAIKKLGIRLMAKMFAFAIAWGLSFGVPSA